MRGVAKWAAVAVALCLVLLVVADYLPDRLRDKVKGAARVGLGLALLLLALSAAVFALPLPLVAGGLAVAGVGLVASGRLNGTGGTDPNDPCAGRAAGWHLVNGIPTYCGG